MLGQPDTTPYDLRFSLLGVPIRVHPAFWLVGVILGFDQTDPGRTLVWVAVLFVSILWHEMGHALASKGLGLRPSVLLYWMGGLCFSDRNRLPLPGRSAVILGGPAAGLVLGLVTAAVGFAGAGMTLTDDLALFGLGSGDSIAASWKIENEYLFSFYRSMLFFNFGWTLVNLLPIWFLDGGQFLAERLCRRRRFEGMRQTHIVGMITAGLVALWAASEQDMFLAIFFGLFAFNNFQQLQVLQRGRGAVDDPGDWWRGGR
ncbi:site-2 protease family protein [Tautonia sociabilis]|uniref:Zn-dependent protease n=1 Tax=Tautonia sociabilis TaxID=2080755 RepID=A0A432MEZ9_9BACT|nr:site-2 protease family protein [Tautonia sociabilis]RUL84328.1 Zn-dependent protease [Tautonia sociabilis]